MNVINNMQHEYLPREVTVGFVCFGRFELILPTWFRRRQVAR